MNNEEELKIAQKCKNNFMLIAQPFLNGELEGAIALNKSSAPEYIEPHITKITLLEEYMKEHYTKSDIRFTITIFHNINILLKSIYTLFDTLKKQIALMSTGKQNDAEIKRMFKSCEQFFDGIIEHIEGYRL